MKLAKFRTPTEADGSQLEELRTRGASWVQFGNEILLYIDDQLWQYAFTYADRSHLSLEQFPATFNPQDLYLIVQKGRLFQQEHPEVPVLLDKGRYLVVELAKDKAEQLVVPDEPCYAVQPLKVNTTVFDVQVRTAERREGKAWIQTLVSSVAKSNYETVLKKLVSYTSRYSTSSQYYDAANWAKGQLEIIGYSTKIESFSVAGGTSFNVIADKTGKGTGTRNLVLVVAHLDSINTSGGPTANAPGADDNGSGSAGVLEIARVLKNHPSVHDLRFVLFGGEEQGLYGSKQYVASLPPPEQNRIRAVINMDMIGSLNTASPTVLLEGAAVSQSLINQLADAANTYTSLTVQTSLNPFGSDHLPFINAGIPAVLTIEGADSANIYDHTENDTIDHINYDLALEILRMNVAATAAALDYQGGTTMTDMINITDLTIPDWWWEFLLPRLSGRYKYNGGANARNGMRDTETAALAGEEALSNPSINLPEPSYISDSLDWDWIWQLRFTLHIDIDGHNPLNVVSGTVARGLYVVGTFPPHFIGRVTSNTLSGTTRNLIVEDFTFSWPGSSVTIDKLGIALTGGSILFPPYPPQAEVTFISQASGTSYGPYTVQQESRYFRDVEVDVDREDHAVDAEPYDTHTHPDRPADLPKESLTLEKSFSRAGIKITRSTGSGTIINTSEAGPDNRWTYQELHDSMELHWSAFANKPQWKMWIFLAELATSDSLGGVMFDGYIDEPGGVDRQGTAVFTLCPFFHTAGGDYPQDNPPADKAAQRELFFDLIHETGHTFNLAHSWQKQSVFNPGDVAWTPPSWMPLVAEPTALSWMNYPDMATSAAGASTKPYDAKWFYDRFRFRFSDSELLFLRHAPARYVQMGNEDWFHNHGRVSRESLDRRLQLVVCSRKRLVELGEPVFVELRLRNVGNEDVMVYGNLDPSDGSVELAVTNPRGERRPLIPIAHTRMHGQQQTLKPGQSLYQAVNMTVGRFGFPFKEPGPYRIEASYTNLNGKTAAAVMQIWVRPPANYEDTLFINELFNARVGRALYVGGTRVMEDVNDKLDWVLKHLEEKHPARYYLTTVRYLPTAQRFKLVDVGERDRKLQILEPDPELVARHLAPVVENIETAANSVGHIQSRKIVDTYTQCVKEAGNRSAARHAQEKLLGLFKEHDVVPQVIQSIEQRVSELK
ncbi:MAG: M28 family metallopeptidase [Prochloraceae cyanobacterium]